MKRALDLLNRGIFNSASARQNSLYPQNKFWRALALLKTAQMLLSGPPHPKQTFAYYLDLLDYSYFFRISRNYM